MSELSNRFNDPALLEWLATPAQSDVSQFGRELLRSAMLLGRQTTQLERQDLYEKTWELDYNPVKGPAYQITAAFKAIQGAPDQQGGCWQLVLQNKSSKQRVMTGYDCRGMEEDRPTFVISDKVDVLDLQPLRDEIKQNKAYLDRKQADRLSHS